MRKLISILFYSLLLLPTDITAQQTYERRLSVSEWIEEMVNCEDSVYRLENAEVYTDREKDTAYIPGKQTTPEVFVNARVVLNNCKFPESSIALNNITFNRILSFATCQTGVFILFNKCRFKQGLNL